MIGSGYDYEYRITMKTITATIDNIILTITGVNNEMQGINFQSFLGAPFVPNR